MGKKDTKRFLFNCDWQDTLNKLPGKSRLNVFDAIVEYARYGTEPKLSLTESVTFDFLREEIDRYQEKYEARVKKNTENINKRWKKDDTMVYDGIRPNTTVYDGIPKNTIVSSGINSYGNRNSNPNPNPELSNDNIQKEIVFADNPEKAQVGKPKKKTSEWKKPTVEEIRAYAEEKGYTNVDAEDFWNFYESKGWMVGSNHMTKWRASVALWNRSQHRQQRNRDPLYDRIHFEGEYNPHAYDEDKEIAKRQWQE